MTNAELIARLLVRRWNSCCFTPDERHELAVASIQLAYALEQVMQEHDRAPHAHDRPLKPISGP
jgi:hypothetical protein